MIEVPIYVPSQRVNALATLTIARGSAIVGRDDNSEPELIVVYYEGNLHGAVNMVTFADRAMFAYWRMRDRYPTVAMMAVPRKQLVRTATLYPEHGRVEIRDVHEQVRLCRWLDIDLRDLGASNGDRLARELRVEGVRIRP